MENIIDEQHLSVIEKAIKEIQFGEVQITIQDGKIVQINRIEKHRFTKTSQQKQNKLTIK
ncbi:MAG: YezD family protein [Kurthia sp.]|nr:YezD family protein [Candidatus Kurthia equi]